MEIKISSPLIKTLIPISTVLIFGSSVIKFIDFKEQTGDATIAFLIMLFNMLFWIGVSISLYKFIDCYLIPKGQEVKLMWNSLNDKKNGIIERQIRIQNQKIQLEDARNKAIEELKKIIPEI